MTRAERDALRAGWAEALRVREGDPEIAANEQDEIADLKLKLGLLARIERLERALERCAELMVKPAHVFSCNAYGPPTSDERGVRYPMTGWCSCGVDEAYAQARAALADETEKVKL